MNILKAALPILLVISSTASGQAINFSYDTVYTEKIGSNSPLWGHNASKACTIGGVRFFVGREQNIAERKPVLYMDNGSGWVTLWMGSNEDAKQNPVILCDVDDRIHILYNKYYGELVHYRFSAPYTSPELINTANLASYDFAYMSAAASLTSTQLYAAAYNKQPNSSDWTFNIYYYHDGQKKWYGPYFQELSRRDGISGWHHERNDGWYNYPVIAAKGHRIFSAATLRLSDSLNNGDKTIRKHWTFWDSSSFGKDRTDHFYLDVKSGENGFDETSAHENLYVAPEAIKQIDDGTLYILSNRRDHVGNSGLNESIIRSYANGVFKKHTIPGAIGTAGMTAQGNKIFVVDKNNVHWSCDRAETWQTVAHDGLANKSLDISIANDRELHSIGHVHVMSDLVGGEWVDAFLSYMSKKAGSVNPATELRGEVLNMRFNTASLCNS